MTQVAIILYGPPASGKDTITAALNRLEPGYVQFPRLKIGNGKADGYRLANRMQLNRLRTSKHVLFENQRYDNTYVVDEPHLATMFAAGQTPVIHVGQVEGVRAVTQYPARWITVLLWCSRQTAAERVRARGSTDIDARLAAWDETRTDLNRATDTDFFGRIDTQTMAPDVAARLIHGWATGQHAGSKPAAADQR